MSDNPLNTFEGNLEQIRKRTPIPDDEIILPSSLGPIDVGTLNKLKGWVYDLIRIGAPGAEIPIVRGAAPTVVFRFTDEIGWIQNFFLSFRSPFMEMTFIADSHQNTVSPFALDLAGFTVPNNLTVYNTIFNPMSPIGPLYAINWTPSYAWPFERNVELTVSLPLISPILQANLVSAAVSRIQIKDKRAFIRSIKRFNLEQMSGVNLDRAP